MAGSYILPPEFIDRCMRHGPVGIWESVEVYPMWLMNKGARYEFYPDGAGREYGRYPPPEIEYFEWQPPHRYGVIRMRSNYDDIGEPPTQWVEVELQFKTLYQGYLGDYTALVERDQKVFWLSVSPLRWQDPISEAWTDAQIKEFWQGIR